MRYVIYTLRFTTPVHFGNAELGGKLEQIGLEYTSDSLFSALCWELRNLHELTYLQHFCECVKEGQIAFSDLFPYVIEGKNEDYQFYVPKPILLLPATEKERPVTLQDVRQQATERKKQKKMKYLRSSELTSYLEALQQGKSYSHVVSIGEQNVIERVNCRGQEPLPYYVGQYTFQPNAGLYLLMQYTDEKDQILVKQILQALGMTGIGGKRSSGLGKFTVGDPLFLDDEEGLYGDDGALYSMLERTTATYQMSLSSIIPKETELPVVVTGQYKVRRRSGFTISGGILKKRNSVYTICAGSCFTERLLGQMVVLDDTVRPPVWRNGKGLCMGLPI